MAFFYIYVLSIFIILCRATQRENTTLLLVQTLSRHGDRAPSITYPTDPNIGVNCFPNGLKELTQLGWKQQMDVGLFLRYLYSDLVVTDPTQIYVNSSSSTRCIQSATAQLNSFYAPDEDWQFMQPSDLPIPIHSLPLLQSKYLDYRAYCPRAVEQYETVMKSARDVMTLEQKATVEKLSKLSGLDCSIQPLTANLYFAIELEKIHNYSVPEWFYEYHDAMKHEYDAQMEFYHSTIEQIRLRFGPFLELLSNNLKNKMDGKTDLKYVLNMSHDVEIAGVLTALNFKDIPHPPFCAMLLFELHQMSDSSKTVRLRYMNTTYPLDQKEEQPVVFVLDGCTEFCPVDYFMKSYQWLIPENWEKECLTNITDTRVLSESYEEQMYLAILNKTG